MNNVNDYNKKHFPRVSHIFLACLILLMKLIILSFKIQDGKENYT